MILTEPCDCRPILCQFRSCLFVSIACLTFT